MPIHRCFRDVNKELAKHNTRLACNLLDPNHVFVETETVEKKRGARPKKLIATHCPFCGVKLEK
jgi:hypothetical protein